MRWMVVAWLVLGGCDTPPFKLVYRVASGPAQSCAPASLPAGTRASCSDVPMACETVLNIRVLKPSEPSAPYISVCEPVPHDLARDLCSIASIDLPATELPHEILEVQVMVWPRTAIEDPMTGTLDCRKYDTRFDAIDGFPIEPAPTPAFGGHTFFHPGDDQAVVTLGCTDVPSANVQSCVGANRVDVIATVDDFDSNVSVGEFVGDRIAVSVGEPHLELDGDYVLNSADTRRLDRTVRGPVPVWGSDVEFKFQTTACIEVLEDTLPITTSVKCRSADASETRIDTSGVRLAKSSLQQILTTLGLPRFPDRGLTVGIVLDQFSPAGGFTVTTNASDATIKYLSADRTSLVAGQTSASGVFVSEDAPYNTSFFGSSGPTQAKPVIGGLIAGKVTIVVLQVAPVNR